MKHEDDLFFSLFVLSFLLAPLAKFIELDFLGNELLVLAGPVIYPFAVPASEFYKSIL